MARKFADVTQGKWTIRITQIPGEDASLASVRLIGMIGPQGMAVIEDVFSTKPEARSIVLMRSALLAAAAVFKSASLPDVKWLWQTLLVADNGNPNPGGARLVLGSVVSTERLDFDAIHDADNDRVYYWYELLVRAVAVNYADFFTRLGAMAKRHLAEKEAANAAAQNTPTG